MSLATFMGKQLSVAYASFGLEFYLQNCFLKTFAKIPDVKPELTSKHYLDYIHFQISKNIVLFKTFEICSF